MKNRYCLPAFFLFLLLPFSGIGQSLQLADSLFKQGREYDQSGNNKEAEFYYREAYNLYRQFQDTTSWLEAGKEYASAMVRRSKNDQAMELYKMLLEVNHPANDVYNQGDLYNSMGWASNQVDNLGHALKYYQKSLPLALESGDSVLIGVVYNNLGANHYDRGNLSQAMEQYQKALPYFRGLNNEGRATRTLSNIAGIYEELSLYDKALERYTDILEIYKEMGNVELLADIYQNIADVQREFGNYDQALVASEKSLKYSQKAGIPSTTAYTLNDIGLLYKNLGEYDKALDYYRQSLAINEEISRQTEIATTSRNIGNILWEQDKYEMAGTNYRRALKLRKQIGNPYYIASSLSSMVRIELEAGNYEEATNYAEQLNAIGDSTGSYGILKNASTYFGKINEQQDNNQEALTHYKKAFAYSEYMTQGDQISPLKNLARIYNRLESDSAVVYGQKAVDIIEKHRLNAGALSNLRAGYFQKHSNFYTELASWVLKYQQDATRAYRLVEQAKARSLSEELAEASQNIEEHLPEDVRIERNQKRNNLELLYSQLDDTSDQDIRDNIEEKIRMAELNYAAYENNLHAEYQAFKNLQTPDPISLEKAQAITDQQTAVLEYTVAGNQLIMFMIGQNEVHVEQFSVSKEQSLENQLTTWVSNFKDAILSNASRTELRNQSNKLYDTLIKPFEEELSNYQNLIIVPDGALAYLPFEALSRGDQYLIENFRIKYEPSLTSLTLLNDTESLDRKDLLAVAGSQFSENNVGGIRKGNLSALPSTIIEVDSIASHFEQVAMLKDDQVSEQELKNLLLENNYQYIHLATHGIIDENRPSRSGLALSAGSEITVSSKEDGMLRSSEIFGLNLNSDMVVLSACNTGLGKVVDGEGMLGMQRSFFYAGTSTVAVSLWNVYDRSTATFMNEFYKAILNTPSQEGWTDSFLRWVGWDESIPFGRNAMAMRKAKLKMIKHPLFNHPVYWAPFIVVGR